MNDWTIHLKAFRKAHPSLSLKEAMIKAKSSYKKGGKKRGGSFESDLMKPRTTPKVRPDPAYWRARLAIPAKKNGGSAGIIDGDQPNQIRKRIGRPAFRLQPVERVTK